MFGGTDRKLLARSLALSQVGLEMAAPALIGLWLDHRFGWEPWGVITGAVVGLVGGMAHLIQMTQGGESGGGPPKGDSQK